MLDPENTNPYVDMDTFQDIMKEWIAHCRSRREMSDLIMCVEDLHSNKQKLEQENISCKLALEAMEEANRQLAEDCASLHLQMKSAQQAVRRESLLKEELEDLKEMIAASEEQKTMALAQNKQLENGVGHLYSESVPQLREYLSQASADHTWSSESTVTSSESGSDILHMTSGDLDCKSLCKKEEEARSASAMPGTSPAPETAVLGDSRDAGDAQGVDKAASHLVREQSGLPVKAVTSSPYIYVTLASTRSLELALSGLTFLPIPRVLQGDFDRPGPGEDRKHKGLFLKDFYPAHANKKFFQFQEAREELRIVEDGGKGCIAGETEVSEPPKSPVKLVNFQQSENTSASEKEVEAEFLRLSLGLKCDWFTLEKRVRLEERSRDLAEENLKKEITNCLKLLESLAPLCEDDNQAQEIIKKLEKSIAFLSQCTTRVASRAEMLGAINQESRVSKAVEVMIQHVENLKRMYAKEHAELGELKQALLQNERSFSPLEDEECVPAAQMLQLAFRRILGTKPSEHRPSLQRFISTYSWADTEDDKCDENCSSVASWVTHLQVSCRRANKVLWLSVVFIVLFAALMSFLTGQFFQTAVEAAPTQEGTSWMSLEHVLWPLTRLRHNGPPPV
ncbi:Lymphoid-restricted membrane protein [Cricetulus griseus]|uniref:Lymphoid-restricted membrane protein n=1 Tax=Cricetulus griseus TaxID=10029 RepID=G3H3D2_CRIGR|nr:Lymphoid-restricted membrane protein [Cricetulus griseus]